MWAHSHGVMGDVVMLWLVAALLALAAAPASASAGAQGIEGMLRLPCFLIT